MYIKPNVRRIYIGMYTEKQMYVKIITYICVTTDTGSVEWKVYVTIYYITMF